MIDMGSCFSLILLIDQGRNWDEQYLTLAFLQFNGHREVIWSSHFMGTCEPAVMASLISRMPERISQGGSLWLCHRC